MHCCKPLIEHIVHWCSFSLLSVHSLKRSFTLSLDDMNDCNWPFSLFMLKVFGDTLLYISASATFKPLDWLKFLRTH
jgi:hypothetical protein